MDQPVSRRRLLAAGASGAGVLAAIGLARAGRHPLQRLLDGKVSEAPGPVPKAPPGDERVERRRSDARGTDVAFYTAVPAGHGDGRGLPVCLVLHGASATAADFPRFGFGRFLSDAVARGAAPFVLAGADGGRLGWEPSGSDDPQRMVHEELPAWCAERGFDVHRLAAWGWSMGGYGVLRLGEVYPGFVRAVAAFSPAVSPGDRVFSGAASLRGTAVGLWCGRQDGFYDNVRRLEAALPEPPRAGGYADGGHTRQYWNRITPAAFDFLAAALTA
jgi:S-formylglutathione hydrolase FrmB